MAMRPKYQYRRCQVCYSGKTDEVPLFRFPADEARRKQWLAAIDDSNLNGLDYNELQKRCICARHFADKDFTSTLYRRLHKFSVPSIGLKSGEYGKEPTPVLLQCNNNHKEMVEYSSAQIKKELYIEIKKEVNESDCLAVQEVLFPGNTELDVCNVIQIKEEPPETSEELTESVSSMVQKDSFAVNTTLARSSYSQIQKKPVAKIPIPRYNPYLLVQKKPIAASKVMMGHQNVPGEPMPNPKILLINPQSRLAVEPAVSSNNPISRVTVPSAASLSYSESKVVVLPAVSLSNPESRVKGVPIESPNNSELRTTVPPIMPLTKTESRLAIPPAVSLSNADSRLTVQPAASPSNFESRVRVLSVSSLRSPELGVIIPPTVSLNNPESRVTVPPVVSLSNSESRVTTLPDNAIVSLINPEYSVTAQPANTILPLSNSKTGQPSDTNLSLDNSGSKVTTGEPLEVEELPIVQNDRRRKGTFNLQFKFSNLSEQKLNLYTGLSKEIADMLLKLMQQMGVSVRCKLKIAEQMLLVFMRLKLGLLIEDLADRFCISPSVANKIFKDWIFALKYILGETVCSPPVETVQMCIPSKFKESYPNTTCVLDCIELLTQRAKRPENQEQMYSLYKSHKTARFVVAIAPQGFIMGMSSYCHKTGDQQLTLNDDFLKILKSQTEVIVNPKLQTELQLSKIGVKVSIPSHNEIQHQTEIKDIRGISSAYSDVERILKQIKGYNILNTVLPVKNVSFIKDVVFVISAIVNLKLPILKRLITEAENSDKHLCLRCKNIFFGMENYEMHGSKMCMLSSKKSSLNLTESSKQKPSIMHCRAVEPYSGLRLCNKTTLPKNLLCHTSSFKSEKINYTFIASPVILNQLLAKNAQQPFQITQTQPKSNLISSRKIRLASNSNSNMCSDAKQTYLPPIEESSSLEENVNKPAKDSLLKDVKCESCCKIFTTKTDWMIHIFSQEHREKFNCTEKWYNSVFSHQETLMHLSFFQCLICNFYFNEYQPFVTHLKTQYHALKVTKLNEPLLCVSCDFECLVNNDLLKHIDTREHQDIIGHHPIIIRKKPCQDYNFSCQLNKLQEVPQSGTIFCKKQDTVPNCSDEMKSCQLASIESLQLSKHSNGDENYVPKLGGFLCPHCNDLFIELIDLKIHLELNHLKERQKSNPTSISFSTLKELQDHVYCFQPREKLKRIRRMLKTSKEHLTSSVCETDTNSKIGIQTQIKRKVSTSIQRKHKTEYHCAYCSRTFSSSNNLRLHIATHTGEHPYKCEICDKGFATRFGYYYHEKLHFGIGRLKCEKCGFRTYRKEYFKRHQQIHNINRTRDFLCEICGAAYFDKGYLVRHMQHHNGREFKCSYPACHQAFLTQFELTVHTRIHTNEKPFLCDICGHRVRTLKLLKMHQLTHTDRKCYKCHYCSYRTVLLNRIQAHILKSSNHLTKGLFPCKLCEFVGNGITVYREHLLLKHLEQFQNDKKIMDSLLLSGSHFEVVPQKCRKMTHNSLKSKPLELHAKKIKSKLTDASLDTKMTMLSDNKRKKKLCQEL